MKTTSKVRSSTTKKLPAGINGYRLHLLAFENSLQANIITRVSSGKIIKANKAACKLLGYSRKTLLTKNRSAIFDINEIGFKKMLKQRTAEGQSRAVVTAIRNSGKLLPCEITSGLFMDDDGTEKAIFTIRDLRQGILDQKIIDTKKEKLVADNISLAKSKQRKIDRKNERKVTENIALAKSKQKKIDTKNEKRVTDNIALAKTKQIKIDTKNEKIVADNIAAGILDQKHIDTRNEKIVDENIALAKSKQRGIDIKNDQIAADNSVLAISKQKEIDSKKEKVVADDVVLAKAKADALLAESNNWIKHIAKTSYDVMWDWDIATGEIYVGNSVEEVFGYNVLVNTVSFADFKQCLVAEERDTVEKNLMKVLRSAKKNWKDSFKIRRHDETVANTESRASIIRDKKGKAIRMIGAIKDISREKELENKLDAQMSIKKKHKFLLASKFAFDVIWDWNILTNEVFIGDGFKELFGYAVKDNQGKFADWGKHIHPDDKESFETLLHEALESRATHWEHTYRFIRANGSIARVLDKARIIRHSSGKAHRMIGAMHDLTRQKELEEKLDQEIITRGKMLTEYKESFKLIFNSSPDVLYDSDFTTGEVIISDAYEKEFGYKITSHMTPEANWANHIHPDDKESVWGEYKMVLASEEIEWKCSYRFLKADGSVANILGTSVILRDSFGKAYRMIGSMQDVSKQKVLEERLEREIKLKEKQIAEALQDAKDTERSDIGKELHDNINQLLGVSRMYLQMAKRGDANSEMYVSRSSEYTLSAIEEIRKLTKGLTTDVIKNIGLSEAIENIARDTMEVNTVKISCDLRNFKEQSVSDKFKLNLYRIIQEQLSNIMKHARATNVTITLTQNIRSIILFISDNGVGFDTTKKRKGIGVDNIKSRGAAYKGVADFVSKPGQGCILTVTFPITDPLVKRTEIEAISNTG